MRILQRGLDTAIYLFFVVKELKKEKDKRKRRLFAKKMVVSKTCCRGAA